MHVMGSWKNIHSRLEWRGRSNACILAVDNSIYVVGGKFRSTNLVSTEVGEIRYRTKQMGENWLI